MDKIPPYDVPSLKRNIIRLNLDIAKFRQIVEKSKKHNLTNQVMIYTEAIRNAEGEILELKKLVKLIEGGSNGRAV